jgi:3-deoxy-D-manno-octulosonate 8-phosphate phosphatase (KDO 8-P phosphatase)
MTVITNNIKQVLKNQNITEVVFCEKFGVSTLEQLPLNKIHEIAAELGVSINQLVYGKAMNKSFPSDIKLMILDVDGVLTDAGMYHSENGDIMKKFNAKDGMGILQLTKTGFQVGIISSGFKGELVKQRAETLKIQHFYLGREHKLDILNQWCEKLNISLSQVAMIGDDVNDLAVMQKIGFSACPADAATKILEHADYILTKKGGEGCVREFIEDVMKVEVGFLA